jgi:hypothetical protein
MASWSSKETVQRCAEAENARARIQTYIDAAYDYAIPWRKDVVKGGDLMSKLMDSTGPTAVAKFAGRLSMALVPPEERAFALRAGPLVEHLGGVEEREAEDRRQELATDVIHTVFKSSRFDLVTTECFTDMALSTGAVLMNEGDERTIMQNLSVPAYQLAIEDGPAGQIEVWHWKRKIKARVLGRTFKGAKFPKAIQTKIDAQSGDDIETIQSTYWDAQDGIFRTSVVVLGDLIQERQHRASPWITPRYWKVPGMAWGVGPLLLALADIRTLNKNVALVLQAAELAIAPPMMVADDGVLNPDAISLGAYSMIKVARLGGNMGAPIQPLQLGGRVDFGSAIGDEIRARVRGAMLDQSLPPDTGAVRSPTEILERAKANQMETGGAFGRLQREYMEPAVMRAIDILDKKGVPGVSWSDRPDNFLRKVQITSPLARAAQMDDASNFVRFLTILRDLGGPEAMGMIAKLEDEAGWLADMMGVPARVLRTKAERDQLAQQAAEAAQAQSDQAMQMEMMKMQAKNGPAVGNSPLPMAPEALGAPPMDLLAMAQ